MKKIIQTQTTNQMHWVGDGFPVKNIFGYNDLAHDISPFLLLDYASPTEFKPSDKIRGVGPHPHRGFETVTVVYDGEVEHRDSAGGGGLIRSNEVQWMTAASGIVHEEMHSREYSAKGGPFEMVQLWVNLKKVDKSAPPKYQTLTRDQIPEVQLPQQAGTARIIAGEFQGTRGPAQTFTPINMWDLRLNAGATTEFQVPSGHTAAVFLLTGAIQINSDSTIKPAEIAVLDPQGDRFSITAEKDSKVLFLGGEPLNEAIVGYGPFVMNSEAEIRQAYADFRAGKMGRLE